MRTGSKKVRQRHAPVAEPRRVNLSLPEDDDRDIHQQDGEI